MTDSKKPNKPHPFVSLSIRVLLTALLFLVIPLLLQSFFLYNEEYKMRLKSVKEELTMLASDRARLIEDLIHTDWQFLDSWPFDGEIYDRESVLQRIPLPPGVGEHFFLVSKSQKALLVGKMEPNSTAIVVPIPFSMIVSDAPKAFPFQMALVGNGGEILWESQKLQSSDKQIRVKEHVLDTNFALLLTVNEDDIKGLHRESYYLRFASLFVFVGLLGGAAVYFFTKRIERPLKNLCKTMERVSNGAAHARYTPDWMGFEINALGEQFNDTLESLLEHMETAEAERLKREALASELRIGHEIQENLLPKSTVNFPGIDIAVKYLSAMEVNGDFYEVLKLENGNLLIAICDTAGKGISACLFSLGLRSIIRTLANVTNDLGEIVQKANDIYLKDAHEPSMFSTLWIGIYDPVNRNLTYCSNGHPPAYLIRGKRLTPLWTKGIALGAVKLDVIATEDISLEPRDALVLYTDGILEAHDIQGNLFNKERLEAALLQKPIETAEKMTERIAKEVRTFSENARQHDDITLLVMHLTDLDRFLDV